MYLPLWLACLWISLSSIVTALLRQNWITVTYMGILFAWCVFSLVRGPKGLSDRVVQKRWASLSDLRWVLVILAALLAFGLVFLLSLGDWEFDSRSIFVLISLGGAILITLVGLLASFRLKEE